MKNKSPLRLISVAVALLAAVISFGQRPGDLVISPTRILLDEHNKASDLTMLNRGRKPIRYRLSLVDMEMSEDGRMRRLDAGSPVSALELLRLSPREISLEPGVSQRIRIAVFFPASQPDGELRSHLVFEPVAVSPTAEQQPPSDGQLRLNFEVRSVVSIPVIVRHGRLGASATMTDAVLVHDEKGWAAQATLHRFGNRSLRGNFTATFVSADKKKRVELGQISGLPVYCPNPDRIAQIRLDKDPGALGAGTIELHFLELDPSRGAAEAKAEISLTG